MNQNLARNNEIQIIKEFRASVSWADEGYICSGLGQTFMLLDTPDLIFLPCYWQQFDFLMPKVWQLGKLLSKKPNLLIWGHPVPSIIAQIMWLCSQETNWIGMKQTCAVPWFMEPEAEITRNQFLKQWMDGIDWQRSTNEILSKGKDANPVMEWD